MLYSAVRCSVLLVQVQCLAACEDQINQISISQSKMPNRYKTKYIVWTIILKVIFA
jgi:hypothetical protein